MNIVSNWFDKYEKYLFSYKNGYFVLPVLGNSPYLMIESFIKMPFIRHDKQKQTLHCNNIFASGKIHYQEIEKNMLLMVTTIEYKKNVSFKLVYDRNEIIDYYLFSFVTNDIKDSNHQAIFDGKPYNSSVWMLIKPQNFVPTFYSKGTNCFHVDVFVNKEWLHNNLYKEGNPLSQKLDDFINSENPFMVWPDSMINSDEIISLFKSVIENHSINDNGSYLGLKSECYKFLDKQIKCLKEKECDKINLLTIDEQNVEWAEKILSENILSNFIGIENLSRKVGMSSTKLKILFKEKYGISIYQYFQYKQMQYAFKALKSNSLQIKTLAKELGYQNVSKFSNTFRKHFKILPSELKKQAS